MKLSLTPTEIFETIHMVSDENLDIRTITMGISLRDCISRDVNDVARRIYDKITRYAEHLVETGEDIKFRVRSSAGITGWFRATLPRENEWKIAYRSSRRRRIWLRPNFSRRRAAAFQCGTKSQ